MSIVATSFGENKDIKETICKSIIKTLGRGLTMVCRHLIKLKKNILFLLLKLLLQRRKQRFRKLLQTKKLPTLKNTIEAMETAGATLKSCKSNL
jgi:hypothetical protein